MPRSYASLYVHVVFSTKHRESRLPLEVHQRLYEYIGGILRNYSSHLLAGGGMQDHVHLLVALHRSQSVADAVRLIKTNSSSWLHESLKRSDIHWQNGYGAFSVSHSNLDQVRDYLEHQADHHKKLSFQDEFRALLMRHGLDCDELFVWE